MLIVPTGPGKPGAGQGRNREAFAGVVASCEQAPIQF
jgi:hypothetical protein